MAARVPPQNVEAEQAIIGAVLLDPEAWDQVSDVIISEDFYRPAHQKIFESIADLHKRGMQVDLITVSNDLSVKGEMDTIGGPTYLVDVVEKTISSANVTAYAKIVREKSLLRKLISVQTQTIERAYSEEYEDVESFIDEAEAKLFALSETRQSQGLVAAKEILKSTVIKIEELYKKKSDITGVATGFSYLDKMTSGLQPGELTIIAARPSMGKTAFSLNVVQYAALKQKKKIAYFSIEMPKDQVMMRLLASEAKINLKDVRSGKIGENTWPKLINVAGQFGDSGLYIDDSSELSPYDVRARARRLKAQHGLDCIMIDYLQLMKLKQKVESREREVSEISKTLKAIAKELSIPVIALAQLNRGVESRSDRRPMLSDLRESGSIEQDADVIMMLYRDDYYEKDDPEKAGNAEVIIGKQRNGPTGTVKLKWESEFGRFKDAEFEPQSPVPQPPQQQPQYGQGGGKPKNFAPGANA